MIDKFLPMVLEAEEEGSVSPILIHEKVTFVYIKHQNLYCILGRGGRERLIVVMGEGRRGEGSGRGILVPPHSMFIGTVWYGIC